MSSDILNSILRIYATDKSVFSKSQNLTIHFAPASENSDFFFTDFIHSILLLKGFMEWARYRSLGKGFCLMI